MKTDSYTYGRKPIKADVSGLRETKKNARRESGFDREIAVLDPKTGQAILTARIYYPGSVAYCSLWVSSRANGTYGRGQGKAGGYGYHKQSAALADAIADAGIVMSQHIGGVGETAMNEAVTAIAKALTGRRRFIVHSAHA